MPILSNLRHAVIHGASRGIGRALLERLLDNPSLKRVFATARQASQSDTLAAIANHNRGRVEAVDMDITDESSVASSAAQVAQYGLEIDLVINCAGILHDGELTPEKRLADVVPAHMQRSFAVNSIGPLLIAKHFESLLARGRRVVWANLSARVGSIGDNRRGGWYAYRASKAAQNMITVNLALELRRRRPQLICVALHPGTVDTDLSRPFQAGVPPRQLCSSSTSARRLLEVIDQLTDDDHGGFFAWDGQRIPW